MATWAAVLSVVVIAVSFALAWRGHKARQDPRPDAREPPTTAYRLRRARNTVGAAWLVVGLLVLFGPGIGLGRLIGMGSFLWPMCYWTPNLGLPPPPTGAAYCGTEYPAPGLIPLIYGIAATALLLAIVDVLGRPFTSLWQLSLVAWALIVVVAGWMAPATIVCYPTLGIPPTECYTAWRPGWEWLAIFVVGPLLIPLASRLVERWSGPRAAPAVVPT